jgi:translocator protein
MKKITKLIISIVASHMAGIIGSIFTLNSVNTWYQTIEKPSFNPPGWIFSPVWLTLFTLMGIALYLVWQKKEEGKNIKPAVTLFVIQLVLNSLWSILFFGFQSPFYAFIEIIILWLFILLTMIAFFRISRPAGWLLMPYFLWVSFALFLNLTIVILN